MAIVLAIFHRPKFNTRACLSKEHVVLYINNKEREYIMMTEERRRMNAMMPLHCSRRQARNGAKLGGNTFEHLQMLSERPKRTREVQVSEFVTFKPSR